MTTSHIGLIGGLAPRAGIFYYEELIQQHKAAGETLNLTMRHADVAAVLDHLSRLDRTWLGTYLGLEGVAELRGLRKRLPLVEPVIIRWWTHPRSELPESEDELAEWLGSRWSELDRWILDNKGSDR